LSWEPVKTEFIITTIFTSEYVLNEENGTGITFLVLSGELQVEAQGSNGAKAAINEAVKLVTVTAREIHNKTKHSSA
jgi:hypothetical protein